MEGRGRSGSGSGRGREVGVKKTNKPLFEKKIQFKGGNVRKWEEISSTIEFIYVSPENSGLSLLLDLNCVMSLIALTGLA